MSKIRTNLLNKVIPQKDGLENVTSKFIANLSDSLLIYLKYFPQLNKVETFVLRKVSDIDYAIKKIEYTGLVMKEVYERMPKSQRLVYKKYEYVDKYTTEMWYNPLVIFKIMNDQYFPVIMCVDWGSNTAFITDKRRANPIHINEDYVKRIIPIIKTEELSGLAKFTLSKNMIDKKIFKMVYRKYALDNMKEQINRIIPGDLLIEF